MTYYDTLDEDLKRAKEVLERGRDDRDMQQIEGMDPALREIMLKHSGGTIFGIDTYAAYKLLESFVAEIELRQRAAQGVGENPFDHNAECRYCDEQAAHRADCPWLLELVREHRQFLILFSDYEEPCEGAAHAEAIWNAMKARESRLHDEIARLRALVEAVGEKVCELALRAEKRRAKE